MKERIVKSMGVPYMNASSLWIEHWRLDDGVQTNIDTAYIVGTALFSGPFSGLLATVKIAQ